MRVVSVIPWRKFFKKTNPNVTLACTIDIPVYVVFIMDMVLPILPGKFTTLDRAVDLLRVLEYYTY
jgi:hypothetical protein